MNKCSIKDILNYMHEESFGSNVRTYFKSESSNTAYNGTSYQGAIKFPS